MDRRRFALGDPEHVDLKDEVAGTLGIDEAGNLIPGAGIDASADDEAEAEEEAEEEGDEAGEAGATADVGENA